MYYKPMYLSIVHPIMYIKHMKKTKPSGTQGLRPKDRKLATQTKGKKLTGNQWQNTPQQETFMENWLTPSSATFGNAFQSAMNAGYSRYYAAQLASPAVLNKWITEYKKKIEFGPEHINQGIQQLAIQANDSRSPDDTRLKAYETLAKIHGMIDGKHNTTVNIVQPILGGASVKEEDKLIIDVEQ